MPRKKYIKMQITEIEIEGDKVILAVKISYGAYTWHKAYGMTNNNLMSFDLETFKQRVRNDAVVLIKDRELKDKALRRVKDVMLVDIILD